MYELRAMSARNVIIFYIGILLIPSIKQIFTISQCDMTKGDCVKVDKELYCGNTCLRTPVDCSEGVDLFGKEHRYQCNCKYLSDCKFQNFHECKHGCLPGFEAPYCQKRIFNEFIKNASATYRDLLSPGNKQAKKPPIRIEFKNTYRLSTVEIYSNFTDPTMGVTYPAGMECELKPKTNKTICTGDKRSSVLDIVGEAGVYHIKLFGCPPGLYGKDCTNKCHCARQDFCHQITGNCTKYGCEDGWYGEKCENPTYVNIAKDRPTNQSSTYGNEGTRVFDNGKCTDKKIGMTSDKAVDGNFDPVFQHQSCTSTKCQDNPYWQVTFDKPYTISQLRIYNRKEETRSRLQGFKVGVGASLCNKYREYGDKEIVYHIKCKKPVNSTDVKIWLNGTRRMLTLCEVEVLQCVPGFYGDMCKERCPHCAGSSKCNEVTGRCEEGCSKGYHWTSRYPNECKECSAHTFGVNCSKTCHCSVACNHINGSCPGVCNKGYTGFNCQKECEVGRYGSNCKRTCHCINNINCNKTTGRCSDGCSAGYVGKKCQIECPIGTFGQDCKETCRCSLPCNNVDGSCPGDCDAGYTGFNCQEECKADRFGKDCNGQCHCTNENCIRENGTCPDGCADGYEGETCQQEKSTNDVLAIVLVTLLLSVLLIAGIVAGKRYCQRRTIPKGDERICETSENRYSEAIPDDTAQIYDEIQMNESDGINVDTNSSLSKSNLLNYIAQKKQDRELFNNEFLRLPQTLPMSYTEATKPQNTTKNLFRTILPYDHSRVKLQPDEISSSDYINANFISNQHYIACQGPTQSTLTDFWRMIWQLKCNTIIVLKDVANAGELQCMQYWPDEENTESFGTIQVTHINTKYHSTYIHRSFIISKTGVSLQTNVYQNENESWTINQFAFRKWPDHGVPQHAEYILEFRNALKNKEGITDPLVVHCSAGVGRTGTYICIDILLNEMLNAEAVDVLACIMKLREERMHMVQKIEHLQLVIAALAENILTEDYDIDVSKIPEEFSRIKETDNSTRVSILEHQFQAVINQVQRDTGITVKEEEDLSNFNLNGVFIDGPSCEREFLVTETPKEGKSVYFLKYLIKYGYMNIVAFLDPSGDSPNYLPRSLNKSVTFGQYVLELVSAEDKAICIHHVLKVKFHNKKMSRIEEYEVNHFLITIWADEDYPSCADILNLSNVLSNHQNERFNKKIAIHSSDTFCKCGLLCIIHILKDAITSQSVINIVRLVRLIKKIEPKIIPDCESYAYIWKVAEYLQKESLLYTNCVQ